MSAFPAVQLAAEIQLHKDKFLAAAKSLPNELKQAMSTVKLDVPVSVRLAADAQQKLTSMIAGLRVQPVTVPVNFVLGAMPNFPGMPGNMGGGMPMGASSLNMPLLMAQQAQQIISGLMPTSSPNWSYLLRGRTGVGGGGGAGGGGMFNPFGPRGLARMLGSGAIAYGALESINLAAAGINALDTANYPHRFLREFDHPGTAHLAATSPIYQGASQRLASNAGTREMIGGIESIPLVGTLARFADAIAGTTRSIEESDKNIKRALESYGYSQGQMDTARVHAAELSGNPERALATKQALERQKDQNTFTLAERDFYKHGGTPEQQAAMTKASAAYVANERNRAEETALHLEQQGIADTSSGVRVGISGDTGRAAAAQGRGDPMGAHRSRSNAAMAALLDKYDSQLARSDLDPRERKRLMAERTAAARAMDTQNTEEGRRIERGMALTRSGIGAESAELASRLAGDPDTAARLTLKESQRRHYEELKLTDAGAAEKYRAEVVPKEQGQQDKELTARRVREEGDTAAKVVSINQQANEKMMKARQQFFAALIAESKRETAERVADLRRQADEEEIKDKKRADQLRRLAGATERGGAGSLEAMRETEFMKARLDNQAAQGQRGIAELQVSGRTRAATRAEAQQAYLRQREEIMRSGYEPRTEAMKLRALDQQFYADRSRRDYEFHREDRALNEATIDARARANAQGGVGSILGMAEHMRDLERNTTNKREMARVQAYERAEFAATRRALQPPPGIFGLEGYHDAIQQGIGRGYAHNQALGILANMEKGIGKGPGGSNAAFKNFDEQMASAAADLKDAAKVIKNAKNIAILQNR